MLAELAIDNFAIIDRLVVRFGPGLTVLTGETGAGKSIIIDALQTALGARASAEMIRGDAPQAAVEAIFEGDELSEPALASLLSESGVLENEVLILRREINAGGRSAARINGRAVPMTVLSAVGDLLVDIHGQSDHLAILRQNRQLDVLDRYGNLMELRADASARIREYGQVRRELERLTSGRREAEQRLDLLRFQVQEIEAAAIRAGEETLLAEERNLLSNAERLSELSEAALEQLRGESGSGIDRIREADASARDLAGTDPALAPLLDRLQAAQYELEDIAQELRHYRDQIEFDPRRLNEIEDRLDLLARMKRKYGPTLEEIVAFGENARAELESVENLDERERILVEDVENARAAAAELAAALSTSRLNAAGELAGATAEALQGLGLAGTAFEVVVSQAQSEDGLEMPDGRCLAFSHTGVDSVSFLVSFNPGEPLRPLERVASGGETSRFLLALKSVLAETDRTPTLVFDEVDVGVGGRSGSVIGERLSDLARGHQVLSITHLPQVAAVADEHLAVSKALADGRTGVAIRSLNAAERVAEIAQMMSGTGTEVARRNAEELLEAAQGGRRSARRVG